MKSITLCMMLISVSLQIATTTFSQNVGIGTTTPSEKLQVQGNIKADSLKLNAITLSSNAGNGKVLTSDASGNASWENNINNNTNTPDDNLGYGVWGDCATNGNISAYNPLADTAGVNGDQLGFCVSISGDFAIVGAPFDEINFTHQGSASIYHLMGSQWEFMQKLSDPDGAFNDEFGKSVFISGNFVFIGATSDDITMLNEGSVSVFQFDGSDWVFMEKLTDAEGITGDNFGCSVSISGTYAIIGAESDDVTFSNQGSASVYHYNGSNWEFMQKITDPLSDADDHFGFSVSISENYIIAGSPYDDENFSDRGTASLFHFEGGNWVWMQKIGDLEGGSGDLFGNSVSISGNLAIVGAYHDLVGVNMSQGSVSIYKPYSNNTLWVLMQKITDPGGGLSDHFGVSVSISANFAIIGTYHDDISMNLDQGSASIYRRLGTSWQKLQFVVDPGGSPGDNFGNSTAIDSNTGCFIIGANGFVNLKGKVVFGKMNSY